MEADYSALVKSEIERHAAELERTHAVIDGVKLADVHINVARGTVTVTLNLPTPVQKRKIVETAHWEKTAVIQRADVRD